MALVAAIASGCGDRQRSAEEVSRAPAVAPAGDVDEARAAIARALRLRTPDPRLLYHAGMIARAGGDQARKRELLARALALSPAFDPVHAPLARKALEE